MNLYVPHELWNEIIICNKKYQNWWWRITWVLAELDDNCSICLSYQFKPTYIPEDFYDTNSQLNELKSRVIYVRAFDFLNVDKPEAHKSWLWKWRPAKEKKDSNSITHTDESTI